MLWGTRSTNGFVCPVLDDLPAGAGIGRHVRKGEHGALVVYADNITRTDTGDDGEDTTHDAFMKGYTVFNGEQFESLPAHFYAAPDAAEIRSQRIEAADRVLCRHRRRRPPRRQ